MGRRSFIAVLFFQGGTTDLSEIANTFADRYGKWANAMNLSRPGTVDLVARKHWMEASDKWKALDRAVRVFYEG